MDAATPDRGAADLNEEVVAEAVESGRSLARRVLDQLGVSRSKLSTSGSNLNFDDLDGPTRRPLIQAVMNALDPDVKDVDRHVLFGRLVRMLGEKDRTIEGLKEELAMRRRVPPGEETTPVRRHSPSAAKARQNEEEKLYHLHQETTPVRRHSPSQSPQRPTRRSVGSPPAQQSAKSKHDRRSMSPLVWGSSMRSEEESEFTSRVRDAAKRNSGKDRSYKCNSFATTEREDSLSPIRGCGDATSRLNNSSPMGWRSARLAQNASPTCTNISANSSIVSFTAVETSCVVPSKPARQWSTGSTTADHQGRETSTPSVEYQDVDITRSVYPSSLSKSARTNECKPVRHNSARFISTPPSNQSPASSTSFCLKDVSQISTTPPPTNTTMQSPSSSGMPVFAPSTMSESESSQPSTGRTTVLGRSTSAFFPAASGSHTARRYDVHDVRFGTVQPQVVRTVRRGMSCQWKSSQPSGMAVSVSPVGKHSARGVTVSVPNALTTAPTSATVVGSSVAKPSQSKADAATVQGTATVTSPSGISVGSDCAADHLSHTRVATSAAGLLRTPPSPTRRRSLSPLLLGPARASMPRRRSPSPVRTQSSARICRSLSPVIPCNAELTPSELMKGMVLESSARAISPRRPLGANVIEPTVRTISPRRHNGASVIDSSIRAISPRRQRGANVMESSVRAISPRRPTGANVTQRASGGIQKFQ